MSPAGRTRTAPAPGSLAPLTMCVASCSNYEQGWFTAYRSLADEHPDLVVHLGDYQYEYAAGRHGRRARARRAGDGDAGQLPAAVRAVQDRPGPAGRARGGAVAGGVRRPRAGRTTGPTRCPAKPEPGFWIDAPRRCRRTTRTCRCGGRRCRAASTCGCTGACSGAGWRRCTCSTPGSTAPTSRAATDSAATASNACFPLASLTGAEQERWLLNGFQQSRSRWDILGQQVFFSQVELTPGPGRGFNPDAWDGYAANRDRIVDGHRRTHRYATRWCSPATSTRTGRPRCIERSTIRLAGGGDRTGHDVDQFGRRRVGHARRDRGGAAGEPAHPVLQRPPRLRPRPLHRRRDARRLPGGAVRFAAGRRACIRGRRSWCRTGRRNCTHCEALGWHAHRMAAMPDTEYTRGRDAHVAYQAVGDRGADLLFVPTATFPIDLLWDEPTVAGGLARLASFSHLLDLRPDRGRELGLGPDQRATGDAALGRRLGCGARRGGQRAGVDLRDVGVVPSRDADTRRVIPNASTHSCCGARSPAT